MVEALPCRNGRARLQKGAHVVEINKSHTDIRLFREFTFRRIEEDIREQSFFLCKSKLD